MIEIDDTTKSQRACLFCMRCLSRAPYAARFCDHKIPDGANVFSIPSHLREIVLDRPWIERWRHLEQ